MKIKLTPAQTEVATRHQLHGVLNNNHLECDDIYILIGQLSALVQEYESVPYSVDTAREMFATRYLYSKVLKLAEVKATEPPATPIEVGSTVYLVGDRNSTFKVMGFNADGSVLVYGGDSVNHRMYRDFNPDLLTTTRP